MKTKNTNNRVSIVLLLLSLVANICFAQANEEKQDITATVEHISIHQLKNQSISAALEKDKSLTEDEKQIITQIPIISKAKSDRVLTVGFYKSDADKNLNENANRKIIEISVESNDSLIIFDVDVAKAPVVFTSNQTKLAKRLSLTNSNENIKPDVEQSTEKVAEQESSELTTGLVSSEPKAEHFDINKDINTTNEKEDSASSLNTPNSLELNNENTNQSNYLTENSTKSEHNEFVNSVEYDNEDDHKHENKQENGNSSDTADTEPYSSDDECDVCRLQSMLSDFAIAIQEKISEKVDESENSVIEDPNLINVNPKFDGGYVYWMFEQKQNEPLTVTIDDLPLSNLQKRLILQTPIIKEAKSTRQFHLLFETSPDNKTIHYLRAIKVVRDDSSVIFALTKFAGRFMFINEKGEIVGATGFDRYPVRFSRISSKFNPKRLNPVLKVVRPHLGVDLVAKYGAEIHAPSAGVIKFSGTQRGYGNCVEIKHSNGYSTKYAHMSRIPKDIKFGTYVSKGKVIGYVGNTGLSTGTHLHYEIRLDGVPKNPETVALPKDKVTDKEYLKQINSYIAEINKISNLHN